MAEITAPEQLSLPYAAEPRPPMAPTDPALRELFVLVCYGKQLQLFDQLAPEEVVRIGQCRE